MSTNPKPPEPLLSFLKIDCNAETYLLDQSVKALRDHPDSEYSRALHAQLKDPALVRELSKPGVLEKLTGYGFETPRGARVWLERLRIHVFEFGPPPTIDDIE